jgi:hypothetical protein
MPDRQSGGENGPIMRATGDPPDRPPLRVCLFGSYDRVAHPWIVILEAALREAGAEVVEAHAPAWPGGTAEKLAAARRPLHPLTLIRLARTWRRLAARQAWRRLAELVVAATAVGLAYAAFYTQVASTGDNAVVRAYWSAHYIPTDHGLAEAARFVGERLQAALGNLGVGPWPVAAALIGLGLLALVRAGLTGVAVAAPLTAGLLVLAGGLHRYPFLHLRTSLFVTTIWMVLAAVGLAWLAVTSTRAWRPSAALAVAAVVAVALALLPAVTRAAARPLPDEDVHGIARYLLAHRQTGDAIVASHLDAYPFAWYWPDRPVFVPTRAPTAISFQVTYPPGGVIVARWSDTAAIDEALGRLPPGTLRVWLVVDHLTAGQRARRRARLTRLGAAVETPIDGLVLARFRAGRP